MHVRDIPPDMPTIEIGGVLVGLAADTSPQAMETWRDVERRWNGLIDDYRAAGCRVTVEPILGHRLRICATVETEDGRVLDRRVHFVFSTAWDKRRPRRAR